MNAKKVIIDCDPGIDDALALMLALSLPNIEVIGITIVCGNVPVEKGANNALTVLNWLNRLDIPVYLGSKKPLNRTYIDAMDTHGVDGLGESGFLPPNNQTIHHDAVSYLLHTLASEKEVSILALGPLTNLAKAIQRDKETFSRVQEIVSMGGTYKAHGNCSPVAEYNYWCDPDAAAIVYETFSTDPLFTNKLIHMIGLDVTRKIVLTPNLLEYMKRIHPEMGDIIEKITRFYFDFHWNQEGIIGCVINDPLAVAYFADRSLCQGFSAYTAVETTGLGIGQTIVDAYDIWKKSKNSHILTKVDVHQFMELFLCRVVRATKEQVAFFLKEGLIA